MRAGRLDGAGSLARGRLGTGKKRREMGCLAERAQLMRSEEFGGLTG